MSEAPLCPKTGKSMVRDTRPMKISYKDKSVTIDMPGWYCHESGESIHTGEDMKVSDEALRALKIKVENLLSPVEVKRIRKLVNLTQRDAGKILGGGPNAFQKYESGEILVSKAISTALRLLERHPKDIEALKKLA